MSVVDDVLGFIRDLTRSNSRESDERRTLRDGDVPAVKAHIKACADAKPAASGSGQVGELPEPAETFWERFGRIIPFLDTTPDTVDGLDCGIRGWVMQELDPILSLTNVERPSDAAGGGTDTADSELRIFEQAAREAQRGAVAASGVVLALNIVAAVADGSTQLATLGQIQGFQQLAQNIIWSLGLSDLGGLAFRPQIAASFGPYLQRYYNASAQAQIPGTGDLIRFLVREVFNPERRPELRSDDDLSQLYPFMRQQGFSDFWTDSQWAAHWNLPSATQLNEMVHRGVIPMSEWERQTRFNDVVPEAIPWLQKVIYSPFTRVDLRRMADLGILTDAELLQGYADIGYWAPRTEGEGSRALFASEAGQDFDATVHKAEAQVIFARIFNAMPDIRRRLRNGFITPEQVEPEIQSLGVPSTTARRLTETLVKASDIGESETVKSLTTAQIIRGAKGGIISFGQGMFLLKDLGWSEARAEFMLRLSLAPEDAPTPTQLGQRLLNEG